MTERVASRLAWVAFAFITLLLATTLVPPAFMPRELGWTGGEALSSALFASAMFTFPVVGALIASRRPRNAVGWILLGIALVWELIEATSVYIAYGITHPGSRPGPDIVIALTEFLWVPGVGLMGTFLLLLFPDGRLPSPRWRPLAWVSAITLILCSLTITVAPGPLIESELPNLENPLGIEALRALGPVLYVPTLLIPLCIIGCAASLVWRMRRSRAAERLQLKWLAAAAGTSAVAYLIAMITSIPFEWGTPRTPLWVALIQNVALFSFVLIPIAVGVAILKHNLYDIDRIINRTLVYGVVTSLLAGVYVAGVFGAGGLINAITGQRGGRIAVAASTLVIAGLFRPLRARVQTFIDRRFYRRRYDAVRTVDDFTTRLRDQLDLDSLSGELLAAVDRTVQPAHASLWIRPSDLRPPHRVASDHPATISRSVPLT
jgi:hypothetical protein